jgi:hypothetical protein
MITRRQAFKGTLLGVGFLGLMRNVFSQTNTTTSSGSLFNQNLTSNLKSQIENGKGWSDYFNFLYQKSVSVNDQSNIAILNTIDEVGYPVGLPMHFEFKNDLFYFAINTSAKRNSNFIKNKKISLLIYYNSLNQSTVLIKGVAKSTSIRYQYKTADGPQSQILYALDPNEVNLSFLDDLSRNQQEIKRNLYTFAKQGGAWKRSQRIISIQNDLDDCMDQLSAKNRNWLGPLLP